MNIIRKIRRAYRAWQFDRAVARLNRVRGKRLVDGRDEPVQFRRDQVRAS